MGNSCLIKKILFPTDLSVEAQKIFKYVENLSNELSSDILILHVIEELSPSKEKLMERAIGLEKLKNLHNEKIKQSREILIGKKRNYEKINLSKNSINIDEKIVAGENISNMICEICFNEKCDLIVMGSRHRTKFEKLLEKSTLKSVLENTNIPVLVFPFH